VSGTARRYVLALNAGSSSLKFELFEHSPAWRSCLRGAIRDIGRTSAVLDLGHADHQQMAPVRDHRQAALVILERLRARLPETAISAQSLTAVGHRIVHGGSRLSQPTVVDASIVEYLNSISALAPLHNPPGLAVMAVVRDQVPEAPAVAVFDTAFFVDLPRPAQVYAVPRSWSADTEIRRYGFHGIAHEYLHRRARALAAPGEAGRRVLTLHLGQGCSITALRDGKPVETSMGFTPLEGLIMGTRAGDLDAGALLYLARRGRSWHEIEDDLHRHAGLRGLSGASDDVRELLAMESAGHAEAALAIAAFCHRAHKYLGAYAAVLGGVDTLVFGGGIGENSAVIRSRLCAGLEWLGLVLDEKANSLAVGSETRISAATSTIAVHVVPVREEEAIARAAVAYVVSDGTPAQHRRDPH
jgi:acetate kinase